MKLTHLNIKNLFTNFKIFKTLKLFNWLLFIRRLFCHLIYVINFSVVNVYFCLLEKKFSLNIAFYKKALKKLCLIMIFTNKR